MTTKNRNDVRAAKAGLRKAKRRKELQQRRAQQPKPDLLQYFNTTAWDEAQKIPAWEEAQKMRERPSALRAYSGPSTQPGGMHYYLNNTTWAKRCVPHLDDPELRRILHREFGLFVISHYGVLKGHRMPGHFETWANKARPPWWKYVKDLACHYLVNVNLRLAMLAQPDRPWRIVTSGLHSTVWDGDKSIFDLNYSGGTTPADQTLLLAAGIWGGIAPGYTISDYVDPLPVGEYMPLGIFFPSRNETEWAQWEKGIEATPALRLALLKGLRRGHLAYLVNKPNYPRALKILNRGMPSAVEITTMADEAHSSIQRRAAEVMVKPNHAIDPAVEATGNAA